MAARERFEVRTSRKLVTTTLTDFAGTSMATPYPWLATSESLELVSTDANDAPGGTGVQWLELNLLDDTWNSTTVLIESPVDPGTPRAVPGGPWLRCNGMRITQAGSGSQGPANYGVLGQMDLQVAGGGTVIGMIESNQTQWQTTTYSVPIDESINLHTLNIEIYDAGNQHEATASLYRRRSAETAWNSELITSVVEAGKPVFTVQDLTNHVLAPKSDLVMRGLQIGGSPADMIARVSWHRRQGVGPL